MGNLKLFYFMFSFFFSKFRSLFFFFFFLHAFLNFIILVVGFFFWFSGCGELPFVVLTGGEVSSLLLEGTHTTWFSPMEETSDAGVCAAVVPAVDTAVCSASDAGVCAVVVHSTSAPISVGSSVDPAIAVKVSRIFESTGSAIAATVAQFPIKMAREGAFIGVLFVSPEEILKGASPEVTAFIESIMLRDYSSPGGSTVNIVLYQNSIVGCAIWDELLANAGVKGLFQGALIDVQSTYEISKVAVYHEPFKQVGTKEFLDVCHSTLLMNIEHIDQLREGYLQAHLGDCLLMDPVASPYTQSVMECRGHMEGALLQIEALQAEVSSAGSVGADVDLPEGFIIMGYVSSGTTGPGDLGGAVEIIKYRDLASYMATHPQGPGGTKVYIEMYNKTLLLADPAI